MVLLPIFDGGAEREVLARTPDSTTTAVKQNVMDAMVLAAGSLASKKYSTVSRFINVSIYGIS